MFDLILAGCIVYDGSGAEPAINDIGVKDSRISAVGNLSRFYSSIKTIKAANLSVSPGFIDVHSHSDVYYFLDPYAEGKISQGVTTEVVGNCGASAAPIYGSYRLRRKEDWGKLGVKIKWGSFTEYINVLKENGIAVNVIPLIGHGNIRGAVKGLINKPLTKADKIKAFKLLYDGLDNGAWGFSTGLIYVPSMFADTKELIEFMRIVAEYKCVYTTHIRGEGETLIKAIQEAVNIADKTGVSLQISHLKTSGRKNWKKIGQVFRIIEDGINQGLNINCDRYPYIASNTDLDVIMPDWFNEMNEKQKIKSLGKDRYILIKYLNNKLGEEWADKWAENIWIGRITGRKNRWIQGLSLGEIAKKKRLNPAETVLELLREEKFYVQAMFFGMNEENLLKILKRPYVMIGSDAALRTLNGPLAVGHPHPRTFGTFTRVLSKYTGKGKLLFKDAIYKMTGLPAKKFGLTDRGTIREGAYADLVVFNQEEIKDMATYKQPFQYSKGIRYVLVNGEIVYKNGIYTGKLPGKVLLKK